MPKPTPKQNEMDDEQRLELGKRHVLLELFKVRAVAENMSMGAQAIKKTKESEKLRDIAIAINAILSQNKDLMDDLIEAGLIVKREDIKQGEKDERK
tara:strand:+ start:265 stop:555 length:291 start_codon:yes stop_codon:yes gene_type:complete